MGVAGRRVRLQHVHFALTRPASASIRHCLPSPLRFQSTVSEDSSRLPRIAQPSIWQSIIPRSLRERSSATTAKRRSNPANYFIWILYPHRFAGDPRSLFEERIQELHKTGRSKACQAPRSSGQATTGRGSRCGESTRYRR